MGATTDIPGRTKTPRRGLESRTILTGTRCTTFVKLPVASSGGSNANVEPVAGDQFSTLPVNTTEEKASTVTRTLLPARTPVIWVSFKLATTHTFATETTATT